MRIALFAFLLLAVSQSKAQLPAQQLKLVDSIENLVNSSLKKYVIKKDTGHVAASKGQTTSYQKEFYIDRNTNTLHMVNYLRRYSNGMLINETYYYLQNRPLSLYRMVQPKHKAMLEQAYYFYNDQTYNHSDSTILKPGNEIKTAAEAFLGEYKKLK